MTVTYPLGEFDLDYYESRHMPMVRELLDGVLVRDEVWLGSTTLDGASAPNRVVLHMYFEDRAAFDARFAEVGERIVADIPSYTNTDPAVQFEDPRG